MNNFSALMKDVQQPWRVERIKRLTEHFYSMHVFIVESPLAFLFHLSHCRLSKTASQKNSLIKDRMVS